MKKEWITINLHLTHLKNISTFSSFYFYLILLVYLSSFYLSFSLSFLPQFLSLSCFLSVSLSCSFFLSLLCSFFLSIVFFLTHFLFVSSSVKCLFSLFLYLSVNLFPSMAILNFDLNNMCDCLLNSLSRIHKYSP